MIQQGTCNVAWFGPSCPPPVQPAGRPTGTSSKGAPTGCHAPPVSSERTVFSGSHDGNIYVPGPEQTLVAVDAETGEEQVRMITLEVPAGK